MSSRQLLTRQRGDTQTCAVIGAGAWGTTLAAMLGNMGHCVRLWARRPEVADEINATRQNSRYLPETELPDAVSATSDLQSAMDGADAVVIAVPSVGMREVAGRMAENMPPGALLVYATKGLEMATGKRMSEVLIEELRLPKPECIVALSGPNLSREIALGLPALSVVASCDRASAERAQGLFNNELFRVYTNCDIIGTELSGALKNVIAVAAGISDGLGYGDNAKASLVTRGLAEICRLGQAHGAMPSTFWGIAGVGDLIATCNSCLSRNHTLGYRVGQGEAVADVLHSMHDVAEGYFTTLAAYQSAREHSVDVPITEAMYEILYDGGAPQTLARRLMAREQRAEHEDWCAPNMADW